MSILERKESIWLELDGESPFFPIKAQQGDKNTLVVEILLLYKKQPYQIPEGVTPRIMYKKPDGHQVLKDCDISAEGKVVVRYTDQMLSTPGTGKANILLISDGEELKTPPFFTKIWPAAYGTEIPESSDEYITFEQILTQCDDKVKTAQEYAALSGTSADDSREYAKVAVDSAEAAKGYYEQLQSEQVTGIKGSSEENFRTGQVTLSAEDVGAVAKQGDTAENIVTFESKDSEEVNEWTSVEVLASKEKHSSIIAKLSRMFKNIRYLYKLLGTTDISEIGDGTATGAISLLNSNLTDILSKYDVVVKNISVTTKGGLEAYAGTGVTYTIPSVKGYEPFLALGGATNVSYIFCHQVAAALTPTNKSFTLFYMNLGVAFTSDYITTANILYRRKVS